MRSGRGLGAGLATLTPALAVSTVLGYAVLVGVGRRLTPSDFAVFAAFWGLLFGLGGTLAPIEQEAARVVVVHGAGGKVRRMLLAAASLVVLVMAILAVVGGPLIVDNVLHGSWTLLGLAVVAGAGFGIQYVVRGCWLGVGRVRVYAALVLGEATLRAVAFAVIVATDSGGLTACAVAVTAGSFAWVAAVRAPRATEPQPPADDGGLQRRDLLGNLLGLVVAAAFTSACVTGFPALAAAASDDQDRARLGVLLAALTVTRVPLLLLGPVQALLVPEFTRRLRADGWHRTRPLLFVLAAATLVTGAVLSALGWAWGSDLIALLYGSDYRTDGATVAAMTAGAGLIALLLVLAALLVALDGHRWVVACWASCFVAILILLVAPDAGIVHRVVAALLAGPALGVAVASLALRRLVRAGGGRAAVGSPAS